MVANPRVTGSALFRAVAGSAQPPDRPMNRLGEGEHVVRLKSYNMLTRLQRVFREPGETDAELATLESPLIGVDRCHGQ